MPITSLHAKRGPALDFGLLAGLVDAFPRHHVTVRAGVGDRSPNHSKQVSPTY